MKRLKTCFNMVEIALAMAVLALGVISIMALFPIGLNANRDSMAESYAADSADQFVHQLEDLVRRPGAWAAYILGPAIPATKPSTDTFAGNLIPGTQGTLYQNAALTTSDGRYRVIRFVDQDSDNAYSAVDILDFEAVIVVWQEAVNVPTASGSTGPLPNTVAAALNVEVSWPARLPYAQRQKSFYKKELFAR